MTILVRNSMTWRGSDDINKEHSDEIGSDVTNKEQNDRERQ